MNIFPRSENGGPSRFGPAIALGTTLTAGMLVFAGLGYWLDSRRGGGQLFTILGLFLGLFYGGYEVYKVVQSLQKDLKSDSAEDRDGGES